MGDGSDRQHYSSVASWCFLLHPSVRWDYSFREMEEAEDRETCGPSSQHATRDPISINRGQLVAKVTKGSAVKHSRGNRSATTIAMRGGSTVAMLRKGFMTDSMCPLYNYSGHTGF